MSWRCIHGHVLFAGELSEGKLCFCRYNALIPCSFCDSKINKYFYWLSRLWIYHYFEYVDCNIWFFPLVTLAKLHPFNAHIWKSPSPKSLFVDKLYENDTRTCLPSIWYWCSRISQKRKMYPSSVEDKWCWEVNLSFKLIMTISWSTKGGWSRTYRTWRKHMENQNKILKPRTLSC